LGLDTEAHQTALDLNSSALRMQELKFKRCFIGWHRGLDINKKINYRIRR